MQRIRLCSRPYSCSKTRSKSMPYPIDVNLSIYSIDSIHGKSGLTLKNNSKNTPPKNFQNQLTLILSSHDGGGQIRPKDFVGVFIIKI